MKDLFLTDEERDELASTLPERREEHNRQVVAAMRTSVEEYHSIVKQQTELLLSRRAEQRDANLSRCRCILRVLWELVTLPVRIGVGIMFVMVIWIWGSLRK